MKAILIAAGEGLRLRPLTESTPKPLLKVLDKSILHRTIAHLSKSGVSGFIIVTNHLEDQIIQKISTQFPDLEIDFVHQHEIKGTANALLLAKEHITDEFFIGVNGDCIYSYNLVNKTVLAAKKNILSVGGKFTKDTEKYGIILTDQNKIPQQMIEKPSKEEITEGYANIGIYSLSKEIFDIIENMEKDTEISSRGEYELPFAISKLLQKGIYNAKLIELEEKDFWFDIGHPWSLLEANEVLLSSCDDEREGTIEEGVHIHGDVIIKQGALIRSGTYIEGPAFIDEGADIGPNCYIRKNTYIGKKSRIGNACEVKNSIVEDDVHAAHLSYIGDSIIGPKCNFGAGTIIANLRLDKKTIPVNIKGKREDSGRRKLGAIIGQGVETGIAAMIMPGIKIGSNSWIGGGTLVNEDVPSESIYYGSQKYTLKGKRKDAD